MKTVGVGVNQYGVVSKDSQYSLVTSGLAGCVIVGVWSDKWGLLAHLADADDDRKTHVQQEHGLRLAHHAKGIDGEPTKSIVATKLFQQKIATRNALRVQQMAQTAFIWKNVHYKIVHDTGFAIVSQKGKWIGVSGTRYSDHKLFKSRPLYNSTNCPDGVFMASICTETVPAEIAN